jgi:CRISPR-associated endonuclease/helicase Cas3
MNYREFFRAATRNQCNVNGFEPMAWQCRLACGEDVSSNAGVNCQSYLIDIPTGCGKTAGVVLAWLWNRVILNRPDWPRRLVYCLPMRTLVEQANENVSSWLKQLLDPQTRVKLKNEPLANLCWLAEHSPVILMGGEQLDNARRNWDLYPEKPAIIIGTQDMLLSRALNRGYGMSRYRWPIHFGLLNNDCLWVCDEVQLMGPGVATACQLERFRGSHKGDSPNGYGSFFNDRSITWYVSATTSPDILKTRDWREYNRPTNFMFSLTDAEKTDQGTEVGRRRFALKALETHQDWHFGQSQPHDVRILDIIERHAEMVRTLANHQAPAEIPRRSLVICNTVDRAVAVFEALHRKKEKEEGELQGVDLVLLHSRFRPPDRQSQLNKLKPEALRNYPCGQIVISTQVIEAGVDISSGILWTEVSPLSSLVQRFGRLNRAGEFGSSGKPVYGWTPIAVVVGLDLPQIPDKPKENKKKAEKEVRNPHLPYDQERCDQAWKSLSRLNGDASPATLDMIRDDIAGSIERCPYSLQRHELLDFFDTDSNLSLGYTDVSPFVRAMDEDTDVLVLWREWEGADKGSPPPFFYDVQPDELCTVPISRLIGKEHGFPNWRQGWLWLGRERGWVSAAAQGLTPGATLLLGVNTGGYVADRGWTGRESDKPASLFQPTESPSDQDVLSYLSNGWRSIPAHCQDVRNELNAIFQSLPASGFINDAEKKACLESAVWHDVGKNHPSWQDAAHQALKVAGIAPPSDHVPLAKFSLSWSPMLRDADGRPLTGFELRKKVYELKRLFRPGMAHEVASALALRQHHIQTEGAFRSPNTLEIYLQQLLSEYLAMSHHGRIRKALRDEIPKAPKEEKDGECVCGVRDGDPLPTVVIDGQELGCKALSVDCRRMGRDGNGHESYTRGVLRLVEHYGPFRLAYLEALLRAADGRASKAIADGNGESRNKEQS